MSSRKSGQLRVRPDSELSERERKVDQLRNQGNAIQVSAAKRRKVIMTLPRLKFMEKAEGDEP